MNGARAIRGETALLLAHLFGTSAQFWLNLQHPYNLYLAQEKVRKSSQAKAARILSDRSPRSKIEFQGELNFALVVLAVAR